MVSFEDSIQSICIEVIYFNSKIISITVSEQKNEGLWVLLLYTTLCNQKVGEQTMSGKTLFKKLL